MALHRDCVLFPKCCRSQAHPRMGRLGVREYPLSVSKGSLGDGIRFELES